MKGKNYLCKRKHFKRFQQDMLASSLKKAFMLTTSGKQNSNSCEHITQ